MPKSDRPIKDAKFSLAFALMIALLIVLWISGGASRADVIGQVFTRAATWAILIVYVLFGRPPHLRAVAPIALFMLAAIALVSLQLVPLPPSVWTSLPGRDLLAQAASVSGQEQPWRPLSISPGATFNALSSLVVPVTTLLLMASISLTEQWRTAVLLLCLIVASSLLGLLQFSGMRFEHPLINSIGWTVSASFANRNHFALFVAIGCLIAPVWAFSASHRAPWKVPVGIALLLLFNLIIVATGSRTGMLIGVLATAMGLFSVRRLILSELRRLPKAASIGVVASGFFLLIVGVIVSEMSGRAASLERALALDFAQDLRRQTFPTLVGMIQYYFPVGSGIGAFDPIYRIHEPDELLSTSYFNHAHNDLLEIVLDAGLPGLLLLGWAIIWWFWRSVAACRSREAQYPLPRLGSGILLITIVASITDYPARTPMIMAVVVVAAVWLNGGRVQTRPRTNLHSVQAAQNRP